MPWVTPWAPDRAELDSCVTCGLCLPFCPTFRLTGDETASPRGRLTAMAAVGAGEAEMDERFFEMMAFCLQCRACEAVCPSMVPYGKLQEGVRAEILAADPKPRRIVRRLVLGRALASRPAVHLASLGIAVAQRSGATRLLPGAAGRMASGMRTVPLPVPSTVGRSWRPDGEPVGTVGLLSGCVMDPWFADVHEALIQILRTAGYVVEAPAGQVCCGALAAHDGAAYDAARMAAANVEAFAGYDAVVVDSAGCGAHLKDYGHWTDGGGDLAARVRDATEFVAHLIDEGALPTLPPGRGRVAVQDPCHLRHAQRIVAEPRTVLVAAGYEPIEIDEQALCCGAAGVYGLSYPETSGELGRRKADQVRAAGVSLVASANPGCELQMRSHLGPEIRVAHPVELYWEALAER